MCSSHHSCLTGPHAVWMTMTPHNKCDLTWQDITVEDSTRLKMPTPPKQGLEVFSNECLYVFLTTCTSSVKIIKMEVNHLSQHRWLNEWFLDFSASWVCFALSEDAVKRANNGWTRVSVTWLGFCIQRAAVWEISDRLWQHQRSHFTTWFIHSHITSFAKTIRMVFYWKSGLFCPMRDEILLQTTSKVMWN